MADKADVWLPLVREPMSDLYAALELERGADAADVKRAYRKKAQEHHPDKGGDKERFQVVKSAYEVLSDPDRRKRYDETGETGQQHDPREEMLGILAQLMMTIIDKVDVDHTNVIETMRAQISGVQAQHSQSIENNRKRIRVRERALKRLKAKTGENILASMLRADIMATEAAIQRIEGEQEKVKAMLALLDDYEYKVDQQVSPYANIRVTMFSGNTVTGGTGTSW